MTTQHTSLCLKLQSLAAEYKSQWPHHCPKCHGWGMINMGHDVVEFWGTMTTTPDNYKPCDRCVNSNLCPRCNSLTTLWTGPLDEETIPCHMCGFELDVTDGMPEVDCECGMWVNGNDVVSVEDRLYNEWGNTLEDEPRTFGDL